MESVERLAELLVAEADLAHALLEVIEDKQQALIDMNAERLTEAIQRERVVLKPTKDLERERIKLTATLAASVPELKSRPSEASVADLLRYVDQDVANRLSSLRDNIRAIAAEVHRKNQQNSQLLESSARFVRMSIGILTDNYSLQIVDRRI